jgi:hypothetical protein
MFKVIDCNAFYESSYKSREFHSQLSFVFLNTGFPDWEEKQVTDFYCFCSEGKMADLKVGQQLSGTIF